MQQQRQLKRPSAPSKRRRSLLFCQGLEVVDINPLLFLQIALRKVGHQPADQIRSHRQLFPREIEQRRHRLAAGHSLIPGPQLVKEWVAHSFNSAQAG